MPATDFSLLLTCGGFLSNKVVICAGTNNIIIDFAKDFSKEQHQKIMDFLDISCQLFDSPISDWNKIINVLSIFKNDFNLISDDLWTDLYVWFPIHKKCGATIRLILNTELIMVDNEELVLPYNLKK